MFEYIITSIQAWKFSREGVGEGRKKRITGYLKCVLVYVVNIYPWEPTFSWGKGCNHFDATDWDKYRKQSAVQVQRRDKGGPHWVNIHSLPQVPLLKHALSSFPACFFFLCRLYWGNIFYRVYICKQSTFIEYLLHARHFSVYFSHFILTATIWEKYYYCYHILQMRKLPKMTQLIQ